jgi:hypothetical protein
MCRLIRRKRVGADLDPITDAAAGARFIASPSFYRTRLFITALIPRRWSLSVRGMRGRLTSLLQIGARDIIKLLTMYAPPGVGGPL